MSRFLSSALSPLLHRVLDPTKFCQAGEDIVELIITIDSVIDHLKKKLKGALFLIDFEKAFGSVDQQFIFEIMEKLGFPPEFIKWTKLGFTSTHASLIINGKLTSFFDLPGGGRQGDNLFPLIFAIVVQGLASLINKSEAVGIRVGDKYHKIVQYADDSTLLVSEDSDWAI